MPFNEALYDQTTVALVAAAEDPDVAVVLLTGAEAAFSAGNDLVEMQTRITNPNSPLRARLLRNARGAGGFPEAADLRGQRGRRGYRRHHPRVRRSGVHVVLGPVEVSVHEPGRGARGRILVSAMPRLLGRQNAAWLLMSSDGWTRPRPARWVWCGRSASSTRCWPRLGSAAETLAAKPISSLIAVKQAMVAPIRDQIAAAVEREKGLFVELVGAAANIDALAQFADRKSWCVAREGQPLNWGGQPSAA